MKIVTIALHRRWRHTDAMNFLHSTIDQPDSQRVSTLLPDLTLLAVAAIWCGSYLAAKDLSAASSATAVMSARFVPSAILLLALQLWRRPVGWRAALKPGFILGILRASRATVVRYRSCQSQQCPASNESQNIKCPVREC